MLVLKVKEKPELRKFFVYIAAAFFIANAIFVADRIFAQQAVDSTVPAADLSSSTVTTGDEVGKINEEISIKKSKIDELQKDLDVYKQAIAAKRLEALTLKNHIAIIDDQVHELEVGIEKAQEEIDATNLEIENLKLEIGLQEDKIAEHKQTLEELLRTLYRSDQKTLLDILLENHSFSEYYNQSQYLVSLNGELTKTVQTIEDLKTSLGEKKDELVVKKTDLTNLQVDLSTKKDTLVAQKQSRTDVLDQTQNDEGKFQQLVEDVKSEQDRENSEIVNLSESVRKRLEQEKQKEGVTTEELAAIAGTGILVWPIESRRITTVFHDPDYVYRRYFEHPGLDVGTPQGTAINASDGGVVAIAKKLDWVKNSNGKIIYPAYNFILIVHDNGLSTVYGHLSGVNVSEGEIVTKGQVIGRTGGLPGTAGAGRLTTGPHLHYEVRLNGIPVNPKEYLP